MLEPNFTKEQIDLLNTPPKPDEIEKKQGLSYLKGQAAIVKANRIFGIGNWSYKQVGPIEITNTGIDNTKGNRIYLVSATVELTVRGCETFVEQGDCEAQGMGAPSISMARKGAVTDGVKRCLKNFGPAFGLNLYFDHPEQASSEPATTPTSRQVTHQAYQAANIPVIAPNALQNATARPVTPQASPIPASIENDPNFKLYAGKIREAKTLRELSDLKPIISKNVVEQSVIIPLREEYKKAENALVEKANSSVASLVGAGK
jgi:hypothetical protein